MEYDKMLVFSGKGDATVQDGKGCGLESSRSASGSGMCFPDLPLPAGIADPTRLIAATLNGGGGICGAQAWLGEARRLGIVPVPPHVNLSDVLHGAAESGLGQAPGLMLGLGAVRDLSSTLVARILAARKTGGPYDSLADVVCRLHPGPGEARALARSGCLDGLPAFPGGVLLTRPQALWALHHLVLPARIGTADLRARAFPETFPAAPAFIGDYGCHARLADEFRYLGVIVSCVPASLFVQRAKDMAGRTGLPDLVPSSGISGLAGLRICVAGTVIARFVAGSDAGEDGTRWRSRPALRLEDEAGLFDVFLPKEAEAGAMPLPQPGAAILVCGTAVSAAREAGKLCLPSLDAESVFGLNRGKSGAGSTFRPAQAVFR